MNLQSIALLALILLAAVRIIYRGVKGKNHLFCGGNCAACQGRCEPRHPKS